LKTVFKNNTLLLVIYLSVVLCCSALLLTASKMNIHAAINAYVGNAVVDTFFYYLTYLGDGRIAVVILLLLLAYNLRFGIAATLSFITAGLATNALKYFFFAEINRPFFYKAYENFQLKLVEGVDNHIHNSFPSGHATQAFSIFFLLALFAPKLSHKLLWLALAILTAFSRMYLSQHWLPDVLAGSGIGAIFAVLYYYLFIARNTLQKLNASPFQLLNAAR
jgi:membrane-associated phospholipid phosphatase